ncbi:TULIP family P47-like protein [Pseudomonadota bacterium AL_CKDN230030165-1A_HGKHYDSX7]
MTSLLQAPRRGVSTLGWDLVYAVEIGPLNARIAASHPLPRRFASAYGEEIAVEGTLGTWQIVPGGSGHRVFLQIPILNASMRHADRLQTFQGSVTVSFDMEYLRRADGHALRLRHGGTGRAPSFRIESTELGALCGLMGRSMVESSLQEWLATHEEAFEQVFAIIETETRQAGQAHAWLRPTTISYAYTDRPTRGDGVLALLAMTNGRPGNLLAQRVMASVIADKQPAAMLISAHLLLDCLIRPALALAFPGTEADQFEFVGEFPMLQLKTPCALQFDHDTKLPDAPLLQSLTISLSGSQLVCESESSVSDGTTTEHQRILSRQVLRSQRDTDGGHRIAFAQDGDAEVHRWSTVSPTLQARNAGWLPAVDTVVELLARAPAILTDLAMAALTCEATPSATLVGAMAAPGPARQADLLAREVCQPFAWHEAMAFSLKSVDLVESLRFSGSPWPEPTPA